MGTLYNNNSIIPIVGSLSSASYRKQVTWLSHQRQQLTAAQLHTKVGNLARKNHRCTFGCQIWLRSLIGVGMSPRI